MRMNKYWGTWIVFIGVFFHSCKQEVKQNNISFYSVDLLEMEKMKGEEILLSDLIESLEIIKLDNREEALIATYSFGIDVSSNYPNPTINPAKMINMISINRILPFVHLLE